MRGEAVQPGLIERTVNNFKQRPNGAVREPRVLFGLDPRRSGYCTADQPARRRKVDVRAHSVEVTVGRSEVRRHALAEPAFDSSRRNGDDLRCEGIGQRINEQRPERLN
jgi:hypothetical protein